MPMRRPKHRRPQDTRSLLERYVQRSLATGGIHKLPSRVVFLGEANQTIKLDSLSRISL